MTLDANPFVAQADSYGAEQMRRAFSTFLNSGGGVVGANDFQVTALSTPNMSVNVAAGQVWIPGTLSTQQGQYYGLNNATLNVLIPGSDPTNPRIDLIAVVVDDAAYGQSSTGWSIIDVEGTPAASPAIPAAPANSIVLAQIAVNAAVSTITSTDITDKRPIASMVGIPVGGSPVFNVKAYGAKGDGVTDDTAAIQSAATAGAGATVLFPAPSTYIISAPINLSSYTLVIIESGATVKLKDGVMPGAGSNGGTIFRNLNFGNSSSLDRSITITGGGIIDGNVANNSDDLYDFGGVSFDYCDDVTIKNLTIQNCSGLAAVYQAGTAIGLGQSATLPGLKLSKCKILNYTKTTASGTTAAVYNTSVQTVWSEISQNLIYNGNGDYAILMEDGCNSFIISKNICTNVPLSGIAAIGGSGPVINSEISNNLVFASSSSNGNGINVSQTGIDFVNINNNLVKGFYYNGIVISEGTVTSANVSIVNNQVSGLTSSIGILINGDATDFIVSSNRVTGANTGINIVATGIGLVEGNDVRGQSGAPIQTNGGSGATFRSNPGYNPTGPQTAPTVPASGTALTNPFPFDSNVYVSGGTVTAIDLGGLAAPTGLALSTATTGGTLAASTAYSYQVTALNAVGQTLASALVSLTTGSTTSTNTITATWNPVYGATSYSIYGRVSGSIAEIANVTTTSYTDTGSVTPSGALPTENTTGAVGTGLTSGGIFLPASETITLWYDNGAANPTLSTALTEGTAYTSLAVTAIPVALAVGDTVTLVSGTNQQTFTLTVAAAASATSLTVLSTIANFSYPTTTIVENSQWGQTPTWVWIGN